MQIREIIDIIDANDIGADQPKQRGRYADIHAIIGASAKETYNAINLDVIDNIDLGSIIVDIVDDAYRSRGLPRPDFLEAMYSPDKEDEELGRSKIRAEINKLDAQAISALAEK